MIYLHRNRVFLSVLSILLARAGLAAPAAGQAGTASLKGCTIQLVEGQPAYVRRTADDLGAVIQMFTGTRPEVVEVKPGTAMIPDRPGIGIGIGTATELAEGAHFREKPELGDAFAIFAEGKSTPNSGVIPLVSIASYKSPTGLKFGALALIRQLKVSPGDVGIEVPLTVEARPRIRTRSMYAHLHWAYNNPYSLRTWSPADWKRYVDLLAHLGFNAMQMWPMMELLPHPLSKEDEAYLRKYAEIIDYLHEQRGMKGFIGSCPNNITEDSRGVPIEKREYFDFEKLLDPGEPANLKRILEHRSDLYRTVPDADGYWVIDSDPGGWKGSPASAFVDILAGHRELIDKYGKRPAEQPLIYWTWMSWGAGTREQNIDQAVGGMVERVRQPWMMTVFWPEHIAACEKYKLKDKAIHFPYGLIENEPCGPLTDLRIELMKREARWPIDNGLQAAQGNAQTPLVQLPNIVAYSMVLWGEDPTDPADGAVARLARGLVCRDADTVAEGWMSLTRENAEESLSLANRICALAADEKARGPLAVIIGDWQRRVLEDLAFMLVIHGRALRFAEAAGNTDDAAWRARLTDYLLAVGIWLERTGYHNRGMIAHKPYYDPVAKTLAVLKGRLGEEALEERIVQSAADAVRKKVDAKFIDPVVKAICGKQ